MWVPIWVFSYTPLAHEILNYQNNTLVTILTMAIFLSGIILMFVGMFRLRKG